MPPDEYVRNALSRMETYMGEGRGFREEVVKHMAIVNEKMNAIIDYQETCEDERKNHNERIVACEKIQESAKNVAKSWLIGVPILSTIASGIISFIVKHSDKL